MKELSDEQFYNSLDSTDSLGVIIRALIHLEHWIEKFLQANTQFYEKYSKELNAEYDTKILIACIFGLSSDLKAPLSSFGKLRNRFAHRPDYSLSKSDVDNIYKTLSAKHKEQLQTSYKKLAETHKRDIKSFVNLEPEAKISLLAMFLRAKLKKACAQVNGA